MKLFVTIYEETAEAALDAIRKLDADHDGIELRAERLGELDLHALRAATAKPIILTYRGSRVPDVARALEAGIDYVDVEWHEGVEIAVPERTVLSHHEYEGMRDVEAIMAKMRARNCAHTKLAATPQTFADNERLLALLPGTVMGMGERGLYSRILAPFLGSELTFVAATNLAAPGQLTLERALEIYGSDRATLRAERVFAVVGNPAGHSLSPSIHNRLFREKGVPAAYTIASIASFDEIKGAFLNAKPCGLSVTAPFKEDAFTFAEWHEAEIGLNARRARAVNTLVIVEEWSGGPSARRRGEKMLADNTDVDGFAALLPQRTRKAAILGAGGTARAAAVALQDAGIAGRVFSRKGGGFDALASYGADLIINTLPGGADVPIPRCETYIEAAYGGPPRAVDAQQQIGGLDLLHAQAVRQHALFMKVFDAG